MAKLNVETLLLLEDLFQEKKWEINSNPGKTPSLYDRFCERLKLLTYDQQKFIIELTYHYIKIGLPNYLERFYDSIFCLKDEWMNTKDKLFVVPLTDPYISIGEDLGQKKRIQRSKTKSGHVLHYLFAADDWTWITHKFKPTQFINEVKQGFNNEDSALLLIDDYVGSGRTAVETCQVYLREKFSGQYISPDNIKIIAIAAQHQGISHVKEKIGVDVVANITLTKGISDRYPTKDIPSKIALMIAIEQAVGGITEEYSLGLERTEGLITFLDKTPNNTFPVYWHESRTKVAPFPRYKNYVTNE